MVPIRFNNENYIICAKNGDYMQVIRWEDNSNMLATLPKDFSSLGL